MNTDSAIKILSVDPAKAPAGLLNPEVTLRFLRRRGIAQSVMSNRNARIAETVFGANASKSKSYSLLTFRALFGIVLMSAGIYGLIDGSEIGLNMFASLWMIGSSLFILSGLLNRVVGILSCSALIFCFILNPLSISGLILGATILSFGYTAIYGPGRFSIDRSLQRHLRNRLMANETSGHALDDYRAFARL